jgi:H+/Cl- antiporter ClcA
VSAAESPAAVSGPRALRLVALGALVGVPAALVAALFVAIVHELEHWLWHDLPGRLDASGPPWYLVLGLPVVGACVVLVARMLLPGDGGHEPLGGISVEPTPLSHAPGVALAAVGTLAFGAVLGPEAPLIALGSVVGAAVAQLARLDPREGRVLSTAGSFSAISALFGGPLVAGMLLLEAGVGLGAALIPILVPGLVAASIGYLIFVGLGDWGGLDATALSVPGLPAYEGVHLLDLVIAVGVGVVMALLVEAVRRLATRIAGPGRARVGMPVVLVGGAFAVGALALLADGLGASSQDVLFSGQASIPSLATEDSTRIVLVLIAAKALAYAVCLGCGFRGGPVFPAVFLGVALTILAVIAFDVSPTLAIAVGTAAGMAAMTRLLFASLIFAGLLVGAAGVEAVPAAALAAVAAWLTMAAIDERFPVRRVT